MSNILYFVSLQFLYILLHFSMFKSQMYRYIHLWSLHFSKRTQNFIIPYHTLCCKLTLCSINTHKHLCYLAPLLIFFQKKTKIQKKNTIKVSYKTPLYFFLKNMNPSSKRQRSLVYNWNNFKQQKTFN